MGAKTAGWQGAEKDYILFSCKVVRECCFCPLSIFFWCFWCFVVNLKKNPFLQGFLCFVFSFLPAIRRSGSRGSRLAGWQELEKKMPRKFGKKMPSYYLTIATLNTSK